MKCLLNHMPFLRRIVAYGLVAAMAVGLLVGLGLSGTSYAVDSLSHIEAIKASGSTFVILEIVPEAGSGSMGYYIDGQEPASAWRDRLAAIGPSADASGAVTTPGPAARSAYMAGLFQTLQDSGLMGDSDSAPLTQTGAYAEYFPWTAELPEGASLLRLNTQESTDVQGIFSSAPGTGSFDMVSMPTIAENGGYVQNISSFTYTTAEPGETTGYYYSPTFVPLDLAQAEHHLGQAIYTSAVVDGSDPAVPYYVYAGTLGQADFALDSSLAYYYVDSTGAPAAQWSTATAYLAVSAGFTQAADGLPSYFSMDITGYTYVGSGEGDYLLTVSPSGELWSVFYNQVYITGGYSNNNWFLKHVFDYESVDSSALTLRLVSVTPAQLATLGTDYVNAADFIVLSAGFDPASPASQRIGAYSGSDLTPELAALIHTAAEAGRPVLADARLNDVNGAVELKSLVEELTGSEKRAFVSGSVYSFFPDSNRNALSTSAFLLPYSNTAPYSAVLSEIQYENFLREQTGEARLGTDITMAACLRYIINYSGRRTENQKTDIRVLDLEPLTQLDSGSGCLSKSTVLSWLPAGSGIEADDITIKPMSTAEFIGKIEDINEQYDLVYIGASLDNFHTTTQVVNGVEVTVPNYNSQSMVGLYYSNMGDTYQGNNALGRSSNLTYRFSGNDITAAKKTELANFASSGLPIIVADELVKAGSAGYAGGTFSAALSKSTASGHLVLTAAPSVSPAPPSGVSVSYRYQWYQWYDGGWWSDPGWQEIYGAEEARYTPSDTGRYRCAVTILLGTGSNATAYTETATVSYGGYQVTTSDTERAGRVAFARVTRSGRTYTVTIPTGYTAAGYQWYRWNGAHWSAISGATSSTLTNNSNNYSYMCAVTVNGTVYYSQQCRNNYGSASSFENQPVQGRPGQQSTTLIDFSVKVTVTSGTGGVTLSASTDPVWPSSSANCDWRYEYSGRWYSYSEQPIISDLTGGRYYCVVSGDSNAKSLVYTIGRGLDAVITAGSGETAPITASTAVSEAINPARVDCNSKLYQVLNGLLTSKVNVMPAAEAAAQPDTVLKYLNLSKPAILLNSSPASYTSENDLSASLIESNTLRFQFTISNATDATPASTRYTIHLYVDQNADGRYSSTEELTDLTISCNGSRTSVNDLQISMDGGTAYAYSVSRPLPSTLTGIIPWKLEIVDNSNANVHASKIGYTYVKPAGATKIKVLQVSQNGGFRLAASGIYKALFQNLAVQGLYDIEMTTVSISQLNSGGLQGLTYACSHAYLPSLNNSGNVSVEEAALLGIASTESDRGVIDTTGEVLQFFDQFDMLILGFADMYGNLDQDIAQAVTSYINGGKAVLFTHDTTSFYSGSWGQTFNSVIRDAVGLDRYGVSPYASSLVAHDDPLIPKSNPQARSSDTGIYAYTTLTMRRYQAFQQMLPHSSLEQGNNGGNGTASFSVSQVNTGQITTFPYYLNSKTNASGTAGIKVAQTHEQYFQLNMSSDKIVVWYCLAGGDYDKTKNDVVNNYYIYNQGNVTYSGAGHTNPDAQSDEAKLFVNTMVAAYRAAAVAPEVEFTTSAGTAVDAQFFSMEYDSADSGNYAGTVLTGEGQRSSDRAVYFKPQDYNLSADKVVRANFYCEDTAGSKYAVYDNSGLLIRIQDEAEPGAIQVASFTPSIYRADTGEAISGSLHSGVIYVFYLPDAVLNAFAANEAPFIRLCAEVVTSIESTDYKGYDSVSLRKLGLLSLS